MAKSVISEHILQPNSKINLNRTHAALLLLNCEDTPYTPRQIRTEPTRLNAVRFLLSSSEGIKPNHLDIMETYFSGTQSAPTIAQAIGLSKVRVQAILQTNINKLVSQSFLHGTKREKVEKSKASVSSWQLDSSQSYEPLKPRKKVMGKTRATRKRKIANLRGKTFGYLEALEPTEHRYAGAVVWKCFCNLCQKACYANTRELKTGELKACCRGRMDRQRPISKRKSSGPGTVSYKFTHLKNGAQQRKLIFELTKKDVERLTHLPCHYCGSRNDYISIDRKDNTLGYLLDNCLPCCEICNRMKLDMTLEEFMNHIGRITRHNTKA